MPISPETADSLIARIRSIEADVDIVRKTIAAEPLAANQQQYLARCFDLLDMELAAVRTYITDLR
ncbi:MAG: hypothetical protein ACLGH0_02355 [Thermoanaerobaculia bacterium]